MGNFDLKKYLAEGRLFEEVEDIKGNTNESILCEHSQVLLEGFIKDLTTKIKKAARNQWEDFKNLPELIKKYYNKEITDSETKKLKTLIIDVLKVLGIIITYPVLGLTVNALITILLKKLSGGKYKGLMPSKMAAVLEDN
jgi:hypothetical protein